MFYFLIAPILTYQWFLIFAAVVPAAFLMVQVYRSDRLEKENTSFLWQLIYAGIISALIAIVLERIGYAILDSTVEYDTLAYDVVLYFGIVAFAEEGSKYFMLKRRSWYSGEFNCQYDGVVYAVFVSLGFALWENISYVMHYGFQVAIVRAVTAIPGHACFGVFMGTFYGLARSYAYLGDEARSKLFRVLAVVVPALIHGAYDFIASNPSTLGEFGFFGFIIVLFAVSFYLIKQLSNNDRYFTINRFDFTFKR